MVVFKISHCCGSIKHCSQVVVQMGNASLFINTFLILISGVFSSLMEVISLLPLSISTMFTFGLL